MDQSSTEKGAGEPTNVHSKVTEDAASRYLTEHPVLYEPCKQVMVLLEGFDALGVG